MDRHPTFWASEAVESIRRRQNSTAHTGRTYGLVYLAFNTDGIRFGPISCRLAWPSELDLMARLAGLRLVDRWGGWHKQPYTGRDMHVSLYARSTIG